MITGKGNAKKKPGRCSFFSIVYDLASTPKESSGDDRVNDGEGIARL